MYCPTRTDRKQFGGGYCVGEARIFPDAILRQTLFFDSGDEPVFLQKALPVRHTLWVAASDPLCKSKWRWINAGPVNAVCWAGGYSKAPEYDPYKGTWSNVYAALTDRGMVTRGQNSKCMGFISEWGR